MFLNVVFGFLILNTEFARKILTLIIAFEQINSNVDMECNKNMTECKVDS